MMWYRLSYSFVIPSLIVYESIMRQNPFVVAAVVIFTGACLIPLHSQTAHHDGQPRSVEGNPLHFIVLSDWGRGGMNDVKDKAIGQGKVARQLAVTAAKVNASFIVTAGDNFHGSGVSSVDDTLWQVNFEDVYSAPSLMIPWYIALGNHDYEGNPDAELAYAKVNTRWVEPSRYFSFTKQLPDSTEVLFVILDSSPFIRSYNDETDDQHHVKGQDTTAQRAWCDSVLRTSHAPWKFVFFHHPAYSASEKHGSTIEIQRTFVPLFERYHVTACFSGHDHDLQHSRPDGATVEYFGCGGGSAHRPVGKAPFTKFSAASLGFGFVSLTGKMMHFSFLNEKGERLYQYEIHQ